ncbi:MAG TPA: ABC transporter permease subunit [Clostridia bacterium]
MAEKKSNKYINPALIKGAISQSKKFLIIWFVVIIALIFIYLAVFRVVINMVPIESLPAELAPQFLAMKNSGIFHFYALCYLDEDNLTLGYIFSAIVAMAALLKDESNNTTEFLFAHPISRKKMFITQMLSFVSIVLIFNVAVTLASLILLGAFNKFNFGFNIGQFFALHGSALLVNLIIGLLMYGIASNLKGKKYLALCIVGGIVLHFSYTVVSLMITFLTNKYAWMENLRYIFVYSVIDINKVASGGNIALNWQPIVIWLAPAIALNILGYFRYQKKDLNCA